MPTYVNNDGLEVRYGADQGKRGARAGVTTGAGKLRELVLEVNLKEIGIGTSFTADLNNDGVREAFSPSGGALPVGVLIHAVRVIPIEAPVAGTGGTYSVGTFRESGAAVDAAGLVTTAGAAGAQVGTQVSAATGPWYVGVTVGTAAYTAGRVKVVVEFMTV